MVAQNYAPEDIDFKYVIWDFLIPVGLSLIGGFIGYLLGKKQREYLAYRAKINDESK